jgi:ATP:cob(I)alamin adenosyltransferase
MPVMARIYTRMGDGGFTLLASGERVRKDDMRAEALGTMDELNSALGLALAMKPSASVAEEIRKIQEDLFEVGAVLCAAMCRERRAVGNRAKKKNMVQLGERASLSRIGEGRIGEMERLMDEMNRRLPPLKGFYRSRRSAGGSRAAPGQDYMQAGGAPHRGGVPRRRSFTVRGGEIRQQALGFSFRPGPLRERLIRFGRSACCSILLPQQRFARAPNLLKASLAAEWRRRVLARDLPFASRHRASASLYGENFTGVLT